MTCTRPDCTDGTLCDDCWAAEYEDPEVDWDTAAAFLCVLALILGTLAWVGLVVARAL